MSDQLENIFQVLATQSPMSATMNGPIGAANSGISAMPNNGMAVGGPPSNMQQPMMGGTPLSGAMSGGIAGPLWAGNSTSNMGR